jgi:hypothetical protein
MTKKFEAEKIIKCKASEPHKPGTEYVICFGNEIISIDKITKVAEKAKVIKVVISENGLIIPNKSPVFPVGKDDFFRVCLAINKLATGIISDLIAPVKLLIKRNNNSEASLQELRFEGSLVYDKTFYINSVYDDSGNFINYDSSNPFLETLNQYPKTTDSVHYSYKIYKTKKNSFLVYKEHFHIDKNGMKLYWDSDYAVCKDVSEVIGFTYNLPQEDILYLYFIRSELEVIELNDI